MDTAGVGIFMDALGNRKILTVCTGSRRACMPGIALSSQPQRTQTQIAGKQDNRD